MVAACREARARLAACARCCGCRRCSCGPCARSCRRRGAEPPPAGAAPVHPPGGPRAASPGCRSAGSSPQRREHRPRGDGPGRVPGGPLPCPAPSRAVRGHRAAGTTTATTCSGWSTAGQRLPAGPDPRGDVHAARQGPVLVVQGPAARASTRSRRSTATRPGPRPPLRPGVRDEGLLQLRHRRRRAGASYQRHRERYIRTFDRLGLPYVIVSAMSGAMGGSASEEFLAPLDVGEDTFVRTNRATTRPTSRRSGPVPPSRPYDDGPPGASSTTPRTRRRSRRSSTTSTQALTCGAPTALVDGGGHAEERRS